jgi:hypothetical protein
MVDWGSFVLSKEAMVRGLKTAARSEAMVRRGDGARSEGGDQDGDEDGWRCVLSKGSFGETDVGTAAFNELLTASPTKIVRRECLDCSREYQRVYYKRKTPLGALDLYTALKTHWTDEGNVQVACTVGEGGAHSTVVYTCG